MGYADFFISRSGRIIQIIDLDKAAHCQGFREELYGDTVDKFAWNNIRSNVVARHIREAYAAGDKKQANPNQYSYSIECASTVNLQGSLTLAQINAIWYCCRYIKQYAAENEDTTINFTRSWNGFPKLAERVVHSGTELVQHWSGVEGSIHGHHGSNDSKSCPGGRFPWGSVLSKLGADPSSMYYPIENYAQEKIAYNYEISQLAEAKNKLLKYPPTIETWLRTETMLRQNGDSADEIKDKIGEKPQYPLYRNPHYHEDEVEFVEWKRTIWEIQSTDD